MLYQRNEIIMKSVGWIRFAEPNVQNSNIFRYLFPLYLNSDIRPIGSDIKYG